MKNLNIFLIFFSASISCFSQNGTLDTSFDFDGIVTSLVGNYSYGEAVSIQSDGKIVVGATVIFGTNSDMTLIRYNPNGSLDTSFNSTGIVHTDFNNSVDQCSAIAIQVDGKILLSGLSIDALSKKYIATIRYNVNGTIDDSFGIDGKVVTQYLNSDSYGEDMILQQDGKIVVVGTSKDSSFKNIMIAIRYNTDGSIDTSFDNDGIVTVNFLGFGVTCSTTTQQSDGKIVLAGTNNLTSGNTKIALARINLDGSLDNSFDEDGKQISILNACSAFSVKSQNDGKIVVAGTIENIGTRDFVLLRYNTDGSLDTNFSDDGFVTTNVGLYHDYCNTMVIENSGNIIIAGATRMTQQAIVNFTIVSYSSNGQLNTEFNTNGIVINNSQSSQTIINSIVIQTDGKIIAVGTKSSNNISEILIARYNNSIILNTLENYIPKNSIVIYPNPILNSSNVYYDMFFKNATFHILNSNGKIVKIINNIFGNNIPLSSDTICSGIYYLIIFENNEQVAKSKFVVLK